MNYTLDSRHSGARAQQRGIPGFIIELLQEHGAEEYQGDGTIRRFFSRHSIRAMEGRLGSGIVRKLKEYFSAYLVEGCDGRIITVAHKTKHLFRR